jgi:hypothetical protein
MRRHEISNLKFKFEIRDLRFLELRAGHAQAERRDRIQNPRANPAEMR